MASAEWIALGGFLAAVVAFFVSLRAYQLQRRTQSINDQTKFDDLIQKIQENLGKLSQSQGDLGSYPTPGGYTATNTTLIGLLGLALEARRLARRAGLQPDWFQSMVLAYAFSQVWDTASAIEYWTRMVDVADTHQSHIRSLVSRAAFYYNRGLADDWDLARQDFDTAVKELEEDPDSQGPAMVKEQVAYQRAQQAGLELMIGATDRAVTYYADSFQVSNAIAVSWRKQRTLATVGMLVLQQQVVPPKDLLKLIGDELQRRRVVLAEFPAATAALFSVPPDGASFGPPPGGESQPSRPYGE
jgi:tetratricopeptide (TPR) repeat protein